jgi:hypothetical protein
VEEKRDEREREGAGARWQQGKLWFFFPPGLSSLLVMLVAKEANQARVSDLPVCSGAGATHPAK